MERLRNGIEVVAAAGPATVEPLVSPKARLAAKAVIEVVISSIDIIQ
jgi:hypothetical protein